MSLMIDPSTEKTLPTVVVATLSKMTADEQSMFLESFKKKKKGVAAAYLWCLLLSPLAMFLYLRKTGLFWLFILVTFCTVAVGGIIWMIIELFIIPDRVKQFNSDIAVNVLRDQKMLSMA